MSERRHFKSKVYPFELRSLQRVNSRTNNNLMFDIRAYDGGGWAMTNDWSESPQRCLECHEPICEHGHCWCYEDDGSCQLCADQDELEYQAEENARWSEAMNAIFGEES